MKKHPVAIGWAGVDITPEPSVCLCGQFAVRRAETVLDPLRATALAVEAGGDALVWVACDVGILPPDVVENIRAKVAAQPSGPPPEKIIVSATHTHTAPYLAGLWHRTFPRVKTTIPAYRALFEERVAGAVAEAWRRRRPGRLGHGFDYAVIGHCRRMTYLKPLHRRDDLALVGERFESDAAMYGPRAVPSFKGFESCLDHRIDFTFTHDAARRPTGVMIHLNCPAQATEGLSEVSADFWHDFRVLVKKAFGPRFFVLPVCGASGDAAPRAQLQQNAEEERFASRRLDNRRQIAERIFDAMRRTLAWSRKHTAARIELAHAAEVVPVAAQAPTRAEYDTTLRGLKQLRNAPAPTEGTRDERFAVLSAREARIHRAEDLVARYKERATRRTIPMEVHVLRLGDCAFATFPQEVFSEFAHRIKGRSAARHTMVAQLAGAGPHGYLATDIARAGGGYSASAYCNVVSPKGGGQFVEHAVTRIGRHFAP